jgi:hypothetical protein
VPLRRQAARLADKQLGLALVVALLGFGGQILAYTYVTPSLEDVSGFSPRTISLLLLGFGAAAAAGNFIAGPIADRWLGPALLGGLALLAATLSAMTITGQTRSGAVITLLVWGAAASGIAPIFQNFLYHSAPDIPRDRRRAGRELHQRRRRGRFRSLRADRGRLRRPRRHLDRRPSRHRRAGRRRPGAAHRRTQAHTPAARSDQTSDRTEQLAPARRSVPNSCDTWQGG